MRIVRILTVMAAATAGAAPAAAEGEPFCPELRRIVAAAAERPAFASLEEAGPALTLGLEGRCEINAGPGARAFHCRDLSLPLESARDRLAAETARCLPEAVRRDEEPDSRARRAARFRLGEVEIWILVYDRVTIIGPRVDYILVRRD